MQNTTQEGDEKRFEKCGIQFLSVLAPSLEEGEETSLFKLLPRIIDGL